MKSKKLSQEKSAGTGRKRNAAATQTAILEAARNLFSQQGYERVGVRDIAGAAGIDPALIIRYFGSKEKLFSKAIGQNFDMNLLLAGERAKFGERLARYILNKDMTENSAEPLLALLRSQSGEDTALREAINQQFIQPLAQWLEGEQALLRAELITACLIGFIVSRDINPDGPLAQGKLDQLTGYIAPVLQFYVDGTGL